MHDPLSRSVRLARDGRQEEVNQSQPRRQDTRLEAQVYNGHSGGRSMAAESMIPATVLPATAGKIAVKRYSYYLNRFDDIRPPQHRVTLASRGTHHSSSSR
jgi:hypothetical protein